MKKILVGFGIFLATLVVMGIAGTVVLTSWVKKQLPDTGAIQANHDELVRLFGERAHFVPDLELGTDRLLVFLAIRDSLFEFGRDVAGQSTEIGRSVEDAWNESGGLDKLRRVTKAARGGLSVIGQGMEYVDRRTRLLLTSAMGEGEYMYVYALAYMSWLGWDPETASFEDSGSPIGADEMDEILAGVKRTFVHQLENLEEDLTGYENRTPSQEALLEALSIELDIVRGSRARFPFRGAMPATWVAALEPHRGRFLATQPSTGEELLLEAVEIEDHDLNFHFQTRDEPRASE